MKSRGELEIVRSRYVEVCKSRDEAQSKYKKLKREIIQQLSAVVVFFRVVDQRRPVVLSSRVFLFFFQSQKRTRTPEQESIHDGNAGQ